MVTHRARAIAFAAALGVLSFAAACDKVPLMAPTGSVITLFSSSMTVPANGEVDIIATVIENGTAAPPSTGTTPGNGTGTTPGTGATPTTTTTRAAGTPVQNGTVVRFTATIGIIEPQEARTHNGEVRVKFRGNGQSGTATITAYSGGASGRLENILVGSAAADHIVLSATPQTLNPSGGTSTISARVENTSGLGLTGVPVTFTADNGTLSASSAITDENGVARTTLTTARETIVTANVAGKTATVTVKLNPRTGITIAGPTTPVSAGVPATFTVNVSSTANIRSVEVDFGDGEERSLGAISGQTTIQHTYDEPNTYIVEATAVEASGFTEQVSTAVTILPAQPPSVIVTPSTTSPTCNQDVIVRAQVSGNTSSIVRYLWTFGGPGADPTSATTTGNQAPVRWSVNGSKTISVTVVQAAPGAPTGDGFATVNVTGCTGSN